MDNVVKLIKGEKFNVRTVKLRRVGRMLKKNPPLYRQLASTIASSQSYNQVGEKKFLQLQWGAPKTTAFLIKAKKIPNRQTWQVYNKD